MADDFESELNNTLGTTPDADSEQEDTPDIIEDELDGEPEDIIEGDLKETFEAPVARTSDRASGLYGNIKQAFEGGDIEAVNKMLANSSPDLLREIRSNKKYSEFLKDKIDWGDPKDDDFETKYNKMREKEEREKTSKEQQKEVIESISSIFNESPEFKTNHGKEFIQKFKENIAEGDSPKKALKAVLGEYALEGKYVPKNAIDQFTSDRVRSAGQRARSSSASSPQRISEEEQSFHKAFEVAL